jgi:hypothetical protein
MKILKSIPQVGMPGILRLIYLTASSRLRILLKASHREQKSIFSMVSPVER